MWRWKAAGWIESSAVHSDSGTVWPAVPGESMTPDNWLYSGNSGIVLSLTKEFTQGVLMAILITWPIAYFVMNRWLQNFVYRINLGLDVFIASALLTLFTALITVVFRAVRAASAAPVFVI